MDTVTQTFRVAAKVGDDYVTVESTITLPFGATDDMIAQAVALSTRIHAVQSEAVEDQIAASRWAAAEAQLNVPATPDQQRAIARVITAKHLTPRALDELARPLGVDRQHLTKQTAGVFLNALQAVPENGHAQPV